MGTLFSGLRHEKEKRDRTDISLAQRTLFVAIFLRPPPIRFHKVTQRGVLEPLPATSIPRHKSEVTIDLIDGARVIQSNGIPNHKTGEFPNAGNPNRISPQTHKYRVPSKPEVADGITPMRGEFGVAVNGVPFDPGAGEFYAGARGWQYEPYPVRSLGIDVSMLTSNPPASTIITGCLRACSIQSS